MLLAILLNTFNPFNFLVGFLILICVMAIVIIGAKWLISLTGAVIPPPLMVILGIVIFLLCLLALLNWSGLYGF